MKDRFEHAQCAQRQLVLVCVAQIGGCKAHDLLLGIRGLGTLCNVDSDVTPTMRGSRWFWVCAFGPARSGPRLMALRVSAPCMRVAGCAHTPLRFLRSIHWIDLQDEFVH